MRRITFYKNNRSDDILHIETEGCVVNIQVDLHDNSGKEVASIQIIPDKYDSENWKLDGCANNRLIKQG